MLYDLRHRSDALRGAADERGTRWESEESNRIDRGCSIVSVYCGGLNEWLLWGCGVGVVLVMVYSNYYSGPEPKLTVYACERTYRGDHCKPSSEGNLTAAKKTVGRMSLTLTRSWSRIPEVIRVFLHLRVRNGQLHPRALMSCMSLAITLHSSRGVSKNLCSLLIALTVFAFSLTGSPAQPP